MMFSFACRRNIFAEARVDDSIIILRPELPAQFRGRRAQAALQHSQRPQQQVATDFCRRAQVQVTPRRARLALASLRAAHRPRRRAVLLRPRRQCSRRPLQPQRPAALAAARPPCSRRGIATHTSRASAGSSPRSRASSDASTVDAPAAAAATACTPGHAASASPPASDSASLPTTPVDQTHCPARRHSRHLTEHIAPPEALQLRRSRRRRRSPMGPRALQSLAPTADAQAPTGPSTSTMAASSCSRRRSSFSPPQPPLPAPPRQAPQLPRPRAPLPRPRPQVPHAQFQQQRQHALRSMLTNLFDVLD